MLNGQRGECAACGRGDELVVDVDPQTGALRGLVCRACAGALAVLESRPEVVAYRDQWALWQAEAEEWSGRKDLNLRPSAPKADALPGCATPRLSAA
jgi:hypothetical protein